MTRIQKHRFRRGMLWTLPLILIGFSLYIAWQRRVHPEGWVTYLVILTAITMLAGVVLDILLPEMTKRRFVVQRILFWVSVIMTAAHTIACISPIHWETGRPGRSIELRLGYEISCEVDYSNATRHDIGLGAPGHVRIQFPIFLILLVLLPLTFVMWLDVINRRFLWINQRHPPHHCQTCGYNLIGNVSGICPECGIEIPDRP